MNAFVASELGIHGNVVSRRVVNSDRICSISVESASPSTARVFMKNGDAFTLPVEGKLKELIEGKWPPPPKPYDAEIEYLESTGTQYVDTGVVPSVPSDTVYCKMASTATTYPSSTPLSRNAFFGVLDGYGSNDFGARISWYAGYYGVETNNRVVASTEPIQANGKLGKVTEWTLGASERKVVYDGSTTTTSNVVTTSHTYSGSAWIFGANGTGTGGGGLLACRVYAYKFWRNGVLLQDFIPVRIGQTGYLFDRVSGQLFGNAGSGKFVIGPDVVAT